MFENLGYKTTIDPHSAWAWHIDRSIERCKKEDRPYKGPLPFELPPQYYTSGDTRWERDYFKGNKKLRELAYSQVAKQEACVPEERYVAAPTAPTVEELAEEGFRHSIPEKLPNGINSLQTRKSDENSKTDILDPVAIETPECAPEPFKPKLPGRPKKARVTSSAERMAALRARKAEQKSARESEARETLGLTKTGVLATFPLITRMKVTPLRKVSRVLLENKMLEQSNRCIYCEREFGSRVLKAGELVALKAQAEHFIPVAVCRNDHESNINASCHICNGLKSSRRFESLSQAREILKHAWTEQGYQDCPVLIPFRRAPSFGIAPEQRN